MTAVPIFVFLAAIAAVSVVMGIRAERELLALKKKHEGDAATLKDLAERMDALKTNFMKVLRPIRQNTESIGELDDDLYRLQNRIDEIARELKKRAESDSPPASS